MAESCVQGQGFQIILRCFPRQTAMTFDDAQHCGFDILRHVAGITADIDMGAILEPRPQRRTLFAYSVLDVDFLRLVTREGEAGLGQEPMPAHFPQLIPIIKIRRLMAFAEEQPVAPVRCRAG